MNFYYFKLRDSMSLSCESMQIADAGDAKWIGSDAI